MSLDTFVQPDTNPTPTRFLLECGAFAPGLHLDPYSPFGGPIKFLSTGTPKAELNPFDSSFRCMDAQTTTTSSTDTPSLYTSSIMTLSEQRGSANDSLPAMMSTMPTSTVTATAGNQSWMELLDDGMMPMPPMSPGFSVSSSTDSPSSPLDSPVAMAASLQSTVPATVSFTRDNLIQSGLDRRRRDSALGMESMDYDEPKKGENLDIQDKQYSSNGPSEEYETAENDHDGDDLQTDFEDASMESEEDEPLPMPSRPRKKKFKGSKSVSSTKTSQASKATTTSNSNSRKRGSIAMTEEESAEEKRQRFLERNRQAASRCREKKRLQTLKIIQDADEVAAKNQLLHEEFKELQDEIRQLKNQILGHRDCGCDVIQKFVQSSSFSFPGTSTLSNINKNTPTTTTVTTTTAPVTTTTVSTAAAATANTATAAAARAPMIDPTTTTCMTMPAPVSLSMPLSAPMSITGTMPMTVPITTADMYCSTATTTGPTITAYPAQVLAPPHLSIAPTTTTTYFPVSMPALAAQQAHQTQQQQQQYQQYLF